MGRYGSAGGPLAAQAPHIPPLAAPTLSRQTPKVGAVCGNSARTVLCGGRSVMGVPTAIKSLPTPLVLQFIEVVLAIAAVTVQLAQGQDFGV